MQAVQVLNARSGDTAVRGLGKVAAGASRSGYIDQISFDDDFVAYKDRAAKFGILVRDPNATYTPVGYKAVTAIATLAASDRFVAATSTSANYALTLMAASAVPANTIVYFFFESGAFKAALTRAGSDTIDGGTAALDLNTGHPVRRLKSDGVSAWTSV